MPAHLAGKADAIVGMGILTRYDLLLDVGAGALWMRPRPGLLPRRIERTGLGLSPDGTGLRVSHVSRNSPAQVAGWKAGDRICRVDGVPINVRATPNWAFGREGSKVTLKLCSGETRELTLHSYY